MIATFPHMGNMHITLTALLRGLGAEVKPPPPITKKTLELGIRYAPETVCLPFKVMLGNFIEALEEGADTIVTCGGTGPCRLGYYAEIQNNILQDLRYSFQMLVIEPHIFDVISKLRLLSAGKTWRSVYQAFRLAGAKMAAIDQVEDAVRMLRPREEQTGSSEIVWQNFLGAVAKAEQAASVEDAVKQVFEQLSALPVKAGFQPLRIAITGEIYVMLEPFVNHSLGRKLGEMGAEVHQSMSLTEYVRVHLMKDKEYFRAYQRIVHMADPYLKHYVGGHGIKTVGYTAQARSQGIDGVIQVLPFTCMPEVIAKNILPAVADKTGIPVLSLIYDEQSGEAGVTTRLEAYIDLLRQKRKNKI